MLRWHFYSLPLNNSSFSRPLNNVFLIWFVTPCARSHFLLHRFLLFYFLFLGIQYALTFFWFGLAVNHRNILESLTAQVHHRRSISTSDFGHLFKVHSSVMLIWGYWWFFYRLILLYNHVSRVQFHNPWWLSPCFRMTILMCHPIMLLRGAFAI